MMNYYEALQRQTDMRWDYTRRNDGQVRSIGYCSGWQESTEDELVERLGEFGKHAFASQEGRRVHRECYHEDGHATKEEACECYKRYLLDNDVNLEFGTTEDTQHRCEVEGCENWTQTVAMMNTRTYDLCDEHRNVEALETLVVVGSSMSSY